MSEAKWVTRSILGIYLTTTGIFLAIFFALWYDKLYETLIFEKSRNLRDTHRTIVVSFLNSRYTPLEQNCKDISTAANIKFAIIDEDSVLCSTLSAPLKESDIKGLDEARYKGKFGGIYENKIFYTSIMRPSRHFLGAEEKEPLYHFEERLGNFDKKAEFGGNERRNPRDEFKGDERYKLPRGYLYTFIEGEDVSNDLLFIRLQVILCALGAFFIIALVSRFLVKIALKPLESKISTLNAFIKDFTHEINTPLSVILLSIERLEQQYKNLDETKFVRMKLAAKTLSQTYSDLIFYTFPDTISKEEERIVMKEAIKERLEYFKLFFEQKKIALSVNLQGESEIFASKSKINKMLDNLISNAIKYNKKGGSISVSLNERTLSIKDSGCGIDEANLKKIFERYARFNNDQGGFGIGLSLVQAICKEYKIHIECHSKLHEGSEFVLKW